ncbi:MAG: hypothetical protein LBQ54_16290 [Planctomycetaceae bacterium]|nr:hypothetical protein [Planctomycetaceae bacterium]
MTAGVCAEGGTANFTADFATPQQEIVADSIQYLQKSLSYLKTTDDSEVRIAPIVTVIRGLLDAGVSPEEPLVRSGLTFLAKIHQDAQKPESTVSLDRNILRKIEACLEKAAGASFAEEDKEKEYDPAGSAPESESDTVSVYQSVASLETSDGVSRALEFLRQTGNTEEDSSACPVPQANHAYHVNLYDSRPLLPIQPQYWDDFQLDRLIAAVHRLKNYPPMPDRPAFPEEELLGQRAVQSPVQKRDRLLSGLLTAAYQELLFASMSPSKDYIRDSQAAFFADNLYSLRTTCRLE